MKSYFYYAESLRTVDAIGGILNASSPDATERYEEVLLKISRRFTIATGRRHETTDVKMIAFNLV